MELEAVKMSAPNKVLPDAGFFGMAGLREHLAYALKISKVDAVLVAHLDAHAPEIVATMGLDQSAVTVTALANMLMDEELGASSDVLSLADQAEPRPLDIGGLYLVDKVVNDQQLVGPQLGLFLFSSQYLQHGIDQDKIQLLELLVGTMAFHVQQEGQQSIAIPLKQIDLSIIDNINKYYLLVDADDRIVKFGPSVRKSIPFISASDTFSSLFSWEGNVTIKLLLASAYPSNELFFFNVRALGQRYQCSVKLISQTQLLILANPVINAVYPLAAYNVGLNDFPSHDYISEYLFLQETVRSVSRDSEDLTKEIIEKNLQLQQAQEQLMHINKVLERKVEEKSKHINNLTYYPEHNPNPVLEIDIKGQSITYANPVAKQLFPAKLTSSVEALVSTIGLTLPDLDRRDLNNISFEINNRYFEGKLFYIPFSSYVRFYLTDRTDQRLKERQIAYQNQRLIEQQQILMSFKSLDPTLSFDAKIGHILKVIGDYLASTKCTYWSLDPSQPTSMTLVLQYDSVNGLVQDRGGIQDANQYPSYFRQIYHYNNVISSGLGSEVFAEHYPNEYDLGRPVTLRFDIPVRRFMSLIGVLVLEFEHLDAEVTNDLAAFLDKLADPIALAYQTDQLYNSNIELAEKTKSLETAMQALLSAQDELIRQERLVTLGQLIAGMAHEINTPLGAIKASVELIMGGLEDSLLEHVLQLSPQDCQMAIKLYLDKSSSIGHLTVSEERQLINQLEQKIAAFFPLLDHTRFYARRIVDIGYGELTADIGTVLANKDAKSILDFSASFARLSRAAQTINLAVDKSTKVVRALNNYAHGNTENTIRSFSLYDSIENVLTILWSRIKADSMVKNAIDPSVMILGNQEELSQVWTNLINNAVQASKGKCSVYISHQLKDQDHVITFSNDGPQIPPDILPKIFDAFFTTKRVGEGTGIGLNICKQIVERHKGNIVCQSTIDRTIFTINLPVLVVDLPNV